MDKKLKEFTTITFFSMDEANVAELKQYVNEFKNEMLSITAGKLDIDVHNGNKDQKLKNSIKKTLDECINNGIMNILKFNNALIAEDIYSLIPGKIIIYDRDIKQFCKNPDDPNDFGDEAHGQVLSESSKLAVVKKLYQGITSHELAHLYGATDHYDPKNKCSSPFDCIMQFNPGSKFCENAKNEILGFRELEKEIRFYMYQQIVMMELKKEEKNHKQEAEFDKTRTQLVVTILKKFYDGIHKNELGTIEINGEKLIVTKAK